MPERSGCSFEISACILDAASCIILSICACCSEFRQPTVNHCIGTTCVVSGRVSLLLMLQVTMGLEFYRDWTWQGLSATAAWAF